MSFSSPESRPSFEGDLSQYPAKALFVKTVMALTDPSVRLILKTCRALEQTETHDFFTVQEITNYVRDNYERPEKSLQLVRLGANANFSIPVMCEFLESNEEKVETTNAAILAGHGRRSQLAPTPLRYHLTELGRNFALACVDLFDAFEPAVPFDFANQQMASYSNPRATKLLMIFMDFDEDSGTLNRIKPENLTTYKDFLQALSTAYNNIPQGTLMSVINNLSTERASHSSLIPPASNYPGGIGTGRGRGKLSGDALNQAFTLTEYGKSVRKLFARIQDLTNQQFPQKSQPYDTPS